MSHRGNLGRRRSNRSREKHIGAWARKFEVIRHSFEQHGGCEWTKTLTEFDLKIQFLLHVRPARISQNGSVAKSARSELHPALIPADHFAFLEVGGDQRY